MSLQCSFQLVKVYGQESVPYGSPLLYDEQHPPQETFYEEHDKPFS